MYLGGHVHFVVVVFKSFLSFIHFLNLGPVLFFFLFIHIGHLKMLTCLYTELLFKHLLIVCVCGVCVCVCVCAIYTRVLFV